MYKRQVSDNAADISNPTMDSSKSQPKVVVADSDGVRVLQDDQGAKDQLALDSIAYDPSGNVTLSGRSNPDGLVRFYVNNEAISAAKTDDSGYWETDLSDVIPGTYTLFVLMSLDQGEMWFLDWKVLLNVRTVRSLPR